MGACQSCSVGMERIIVSTPPENMNSGCVAEAGVYAAWLLGSAAIGCVAGVLHWVVLPIPPFLANDLLDARGVAPRVGVCVAGTLLAGVLLLRLTRWALGRAGRTKLSVAVIMGLGISALAAYTVWHTYLLVSDAAWSEDFLGASLASIVFAVSVDPLLSMALFVLALFSSGITKAPAYYAVLAYVAAISAYLIAMVLWGAVRTTRQQRPLGRSVDACQPPAAPVGLQEHQEGDKVRGA